MKIGVIKIADFLNPKKENINYKNIKNDNISELYNNDKHPPIAWHSYAAATNGFVHLYNESGDNDIMYDCDFAIVTIDKYIAPLEIVVKLLQARNIPIAFAFHEGYQTIQRLPTLSKNLHLFKTIRNIAAKNNITSWLDPMPHQMKQFLNLYSKLASPEFTVHSVPSAWPMHVSKDISLPINDRKGIMIGASDFGNFTLRNTIIDFVIAVKLSNKLNVPVTIVLGHDHDTCKYFIKTYKHWFNNVNNLNVVVSKMSYIKWLKLLAKHRICINCDMSLSQGQVVGDCTLVNIPSIGGNATIQGIIYPDLAWDTTDLYKVEQVAYDLYTNNAYYNAVCQSSYVNAVNNLSFPAVRKNLERIYLYDKTRH